MVQYLHGVLNCIQRESGTLILNLKIRFLVRQSHLTWYEINSEIISQNILTPLNYNLTEPLFFQTLLNRVTLYILGTSV